MFIFYVDLDQNGSNYPVKCESFANSQSFDGMIELHYVQGVKDSHYPEDKVNLICLKKSQVNYFYMLDKVEPEEEPEVDDFFEEDSESGENNIAVPVELDRSKKKRNRKKLY